MVQLKPLRSDEGASAPSGFLVVELASSRWGRERPGSRDRDRSGGAESLRSFAGVDDGGLSEELVEEDPEALCTQVLFAAGDAAVGERNVGAEAVHDVRVARWPRFS